MIFKVRDVNSAGLLSKAASDREDTVRAVQTIARTLGVSDLDLTVSIGRDPDKGVPN